MSTHFVAVQSGKRHWASRIRLALITVLLSLSIFSVSSLISPEQALAIQCEGINYSISGTAHHGITFDEGRGICYTDTVNNYPAVVNGWSAETWNEQVDVSTGFHGTFSIWDSCVVVRDPGFPGSNVVHGAGICTTGQEGVLFNNSGTYDLEWTLTASGGAVYVVKVNISVVVGAGGGYIINSMGILGGNFLSGPPDITSNGGTSNETASVAENQTAVTDVQSIDDSDSEGSGLTYSVSGGVDQAKFNIDASTGVLTFATAPDFENPTDDGLNNIYDVQVTVTDSDGLTDVQNLAVTVTDVVDEDTPGTVILGAPSSTDGVTPFDISVQFTENVTGFELADITVGGGTISNFATVDGHTYTATITPAGTGDVTLDVAADVAIDGGGNGNTAAKQVIVRDKVVEETQKTIGAFMQQRAGIIASLQPNIGGFVIGGNRTLNFTGSENGVVLNYAGSATLNAASQGIDDSFAATANDNRTGNFDVWTQLHAANTNAGNANSKLWLGYAGAHYFLSEDMLVGALVQLDYVEGSNKIAGSSIDGTGWMAGPYIAGKVNGQDIYYEARASWGESYNSVSPFGTYTDRFDTERWMVSGKLTGDYEFGDITFSPNVSLSYFSEEQRAYIDSLSNLIPSQSIASGELRFGPAISKAFTLNDGAILTPKVGISGVYTIVATSSNSALDLTFDQGNFRAQLALGLSLATIHGATIGTDLFYDGLGIENYETWGGNMSLRVPMQ